MNSIRPLIMACLLALSQAGKFGMRPRCPDLKHLITPNMIVEYSTTSTHLTPGDEVWISCKPGYVIRNGDDQLFCQDDGSWDGEMGRCEEASCKSPKVPENGTILSDMNTRNNRIPEGSEIIYTCSSGFRLTGNSWNKCVNGRWKFDNPRCVAIKCHNPGTPENGVRRGKNFEIGSKVSYSCFSGHTLIGSFERYCLPNGQWSGELTRCNSKSNYCPDPGVPINAIKTGHIYHEGFSVTYQCHPGFTLLGSETRQCQSDRTWTGDEPKCHSSYDFDNSEDVLRRLKAAMKITAEFPDSHPVVTEVPQLDAELFTTEDPGQGGGGGSFIPIHTVFNFDFWPWGGSREDTNNADTITQRPPVIHQPRVITYFVFDSSGSIGNDNFLMCIHFAKALVKKMKISGSGNRAGALSFNSEVTIHFMPAGISSTAEALEALDEIVYNSGGTAINKALATVLNDVIPSTRENLGLNTKSVIYLFTDGKANMAGDPKFWAEKLRKEASVEINCIGIAGARESDLYKIASEPHKEHVFVLSSYSQMDHLSQLIIDDTKDYSRCGFGLEDVAIRHIQDGRSESMRNASRPWPWMAAIYISHSIFEVPRKIKCGGSIVGRQWILTAAHCLVDKNNDNEVLDPRRVIVKLGLTTLKNENTAMEFSPESFVLHPRYNRETLDYDIALIKLEQFIEYNTYARPVCLPPEVLPEGSSLYKYKEYGFVTGWGTTKEVLPSQRALSRLRNVEHLKVVNLQIQSRDRCRQSLRDTPYELTKSMFCAGSETSDIDTCEGDSGGPMVQSQFDNEGNIYWSQVGVVSWGIGCRQPNTYGFYSHVQSVRKWITDTID